MCPEAQTKRDMHFISKKKGLIPEPARFQEEPQTVRKAGDGSKLFQNLVKSITRDL